MSESLFNYVGAFLRVLMLLFMGYLFYSGTIRAAETALEDQSPGVSAPVAHDDFLAYRSLDEIAFGGGVYVVGTGRGTVLTSGDGDVWTAQADVQGSLRNFSWSEGRFLGTKGSFIYESMDGASWDLLGSAAHELNGVFFENGHYLYISGSYVYSTDDIGSGLSPNVFYAGQWIYELYPLGEGNWTISNRTGIFHSGDHGENWQEALEIMNWNSVFVSSEQRALAIIRETFSKTGVWYSDDRGLTWVEVADSLPEAMMAQAIHSAAWDGTRFVALGSNGTAFVSPDGIDWELMSAVPVETLHDIVGVEGQMIAVGDKGAIRVLDAEGRWSNRYAGSSPRINGATYFQGKPLLAGDAGFIGSQSEDGSWASVESVTLENLFAAESNGEKAVVVGDQGTILVSSDGLLWGEKEAGTNYALRGVAWTGAQFVVVGYGGVVLTSQDGETWTRVATLGGRLQAVRWTGAECLAVGDGGAIFRSPTGTNWVEEDYSGSDVDFRGVATLGDTHVIVGLGGMVLRSHQGGAWEAIQISESDLENVISLEGGFMAVGQRGTFYESKFGAVWGASGYGTSERLYALDEEDGQIVVAGSAGNLYTHEWNPGTAPLPDIFLTIPTSIPEDSGEVTVTVQLSQAADHAVEFTYGFSGGTADQFLDYRVNPVEDRTLVIPAGESATSFSIRIQDDLLVEETEAFYLGFERVEGAGILQVASRIEIIDNDEESHGVLVPRAGAFREKHYTATILLEAATPFVGRARISYETRNGSAKAPEDFFPVKGTLVFEEGDTKGWITVQLQANDGVEHEESFYIDFTDVVGVEIAGGNALEVVIAAQDEAVSVRDAALVHEREDSLAKFFIENRSSNGEWIDYETEDGSAVAGEDYVPKQGRIFVAPGGTFVEVPILDDGRVEKNEAFGLLISSETAVIDQDFASVRIYSDDVDEFGYGPVYERSKSRYDSVVWTGDQFLVQTPYGIASSKTGESWMLETGAKYSFSLGTWMLGGGKIVSTLPGVASRDGISWRDIPGDLAGEHGLIDRRDPQNIFWAGDRFVMRYRTNPYGHYSDAIVVSDNGFDWQLAVENVSRDYLTAPGDLSWSGTRLWFSDHIYRDNRMSLYDSIRGDVWELVDEVQFSGDSGGGPEWFSDRLMVTVGGLRLYNDLSISTDTWESLDRGTFWSSRATYNGEHWVDIREDGIYTSYDGFEWEFDSAGDGGLSGLSSVAWNGDFYLGTTYAGIFRSLDGLVWEPVEFGIEEVNLSRLLVRNGKIYSAGSSYWQLKDGEGWDPVADADASYVEAFLSQGYTVFERQNRMYKIGGASGNSNVIAVSEDRGETWTSDYYRAFDQFYDLDGNEDGLYVVGWDSPFRKLFYKIFEDSTWREQQINLDGAWRKIAVSPDRILLSTTTGETAISSDQGLTWTTGGMSLNGSASIARLMYENGKFFAISSWSEILVSPDGITWDLLDQPGDDLVWSGGDWLLMRKGALYRSLDLEVWTPQVIDHFTVGNIGIPDQVYESSPIRRVESPPGIFITVDAPSYVVEGEAEFLTLTFRLSEASDVPVEFFVEFGHDEEVANYPYRYTDWVQFKPGETVKEIRITITNDEVYSGKVVMHVNPLHMGNASVDDASRSLVVRLYDNEMDHLGNQDLVHLDAVTDLDLRGITFHNGIGVIVGESGVVLRSEDSGRTWEVFDSGIGDFFLEEVAWAKDRFIAVGQGGRVVSSFDGRTWTRLDSGTSRYLYGVHWSGDIAVIVGSGTVLSSKNLVDWTERDSGVSALGYSGDEIIFKGVTSGDHGIVIAGEHGLTAHSINGETWTGSLIDSSLDVFIQNLYWEGSRYLALYLNGAYESSNGIDWNSANGSYYIRGFRGMAHNLSDLAAVQAKTLYFYSRASLKILDSYYLDKYGSEKFYEMDLWDVSWSGDAFVVVGDQGFIGRKVSYNNAMADWNRWLWAYDESGQRNMTIDSAEGGLTAINNGEGIPNFVAYALRLNPWRIVDGNLLSLDTSGESPSLRIAGNPSRSDFAEVEVQRSDDLSLWETVSVWTGKEWLGDVQPPLGYGGYTVTLEDEPSEGDPEKFYRLRIQMK